MIEPMLSSVCDLTQLAAISSFALSKALGTSAAALLKPLHSLMRMVPSLRLSWLGDLEHSLIYSAGSLSQWTFLLCPRSP